MTKTRKQKSNANLRSKRTVGGRISQSRPPRQPNVQFATRMSEKQVVDLRASLLTIALTQMPELEMPSAEEEHYWGLHKEEFEAMLFFPGATAGSQVRIVKTVPWHGKYYCVVAVSDAQSPLGESGLMYVGRRFDKQPTPAEELSCLLRCVEPQWVVTDY